MVGEGSAGSLWTHDRRDLQAAIAQRGGLLGDLYERAVDALSEQPITAVAVVMAGHCIRDLVNALSDAIGEEGMIPKYENVSNPARTLVEVWDQHEGVLNQIVASADENGQVAQEISSVPRAVILAASEVVAASRRGTANARSRYAALILGRIEAVNEKDPTVTLFKKSVDAFEKRRHPGRARGVDADDNIAADLVKELETIEWVLNGLLGDFFEAAEDVFDILDAANRREGNDSDE